MSEPPYPLTEWLTSRLDPEYVAFYNKHVINTQQVHLQSVAASRKNGLPLGAGPIQPVGDTRDYPIARQESEGPPVMVRVFTPQGQAPEKGWPIAVYYHGGGWVLGDINTENVVCSHICSRASCVVVSVDYRLAPEDPFPAAVLDSWEAVLWIKQSLKTIVAVDTSKIAVGGSSAGGNLAAVMTQRCVDLGDPTFAVQFLNVPVMDNTLTPETSSTWKDLEFTAALPSAKMLWYRRHYLPDEKEWANVEASPSYWKGDWSALPQALIVVGEYDLLKGEGEAYGRMLKANGVNADVRVMKGMPHPFLAMDGVLQAGRDTITAICESLSTVFKGDAIGTTI